MSTTTSAEYYAELPAEVRARYSEDGWLALSEGERRSIVAPEYMELPTPIRAMYSYKAWQWMSDACKAGLVTACTEPDPI